MATQRAFEASIEDIGAAFAGPWRRPRQMLASQEYDSHASIHDDATARKLGFRGGTIEGPTHFSQFAPLGAHAWGRRWFEEGCVSAHYRTAAYEGEPVRAFMSRPANDATSARIWMLKEDGSEVLTGTASVGPHAPPSELDQRLAGLVPPDPCVILRDVKPGMTLARHSVTMAMDQNMGALYPFSLRQKLQAITEPSPWYGEASPWGRPIIPMEMISVLVQYAWPTGRLPVRGPVVGLFADQEIRLIKGPLLVGETYDVEREVEALSGSRRTESVWVRTRIYAAGGDELVARMLLNSANLKDSYADYDKDLAAIVA